MIGGNITEFIDKLYFGQELVFVYKETQYFIQGWWEESNSAAVMVLSEMNSKPFDGYLWEYHSAKMSHCAEAFLSAPIWDGNDFMSIQEEITWTEW